MNSDWYPNPNAQFQAVTVGDKVQLKLKMSNFFYSIMAKVSNVTADGINAKIIGIADWDDRVILVADEATKLVGKIVTFKPGYIHRINS